MESNVFLGLSCWLSFSGVSIELSTFASGLDPDLRDAYQRSPLHCAAFGGFINCMNLLLENGANVDLQDKEVRAGFYTFIYLMFCTAISKVSSSRCMTVTLNSRNAVFCRSSLIKALLLTFAWHCSALGRVVNGPHFEARTRPEPDILFEVRFIPKAKFTEWVKMCATAVYQKT